MPDLENRQTSPKRLYILAGFLLAVLAAYTWVLFDTQYNKGQYYLEQSVRTITRTEAIESSRGIITDRQGRELVANRQTYNLTFDPAKLERGEDENAAILRLVQLCRDQGLTWQDNLPLSRSFPYGYTLDGLSSTQLSRFNIFLQKRMELVSADLENKDLTAHMLTSAGLTSTLLLETLREEFAIPEIWSDQDARDVLGVLYELSVRQLINTTAYVMIEDVDSSLVALINDGAYQGASVVSASTREYRTDYAAHILGTVGDINPEEYQQLKDQGYAMDATIGKDGAERAFESYLKGSNGRRVVSTNSEGKITGEYYKTEPKPGDTVALTIDLELQKATEDALSATVSAMTEEDGVARGAGAAVIQIGTGDILSLASYPTFNLSTYRQEFNDLAADPAQPMFNRATQGTYPPGSTFKPLTSVAALESGIITPSTTIQDKGRYTYYAPTYQPKCWIYPGSHGKINVSEAITHSCNYFFYEVGRLTGIQTINDYALAFGLGESTGIEIGDKAGVLAGPDYAERAGKTWTDGQTISAAIGQSYNLFTPLQLANYTATLAGGGEHYQAHLLKEVKSYDNTRVVYTQPDTPLNTVEMSESTLNAVKKGMLDLTTRGSLAGYFSSCVVSAGAKTGTAQITKDVENNGVFICFAPNEDPEIALAIGIEKGGSGSALASTAVEILNAWFTADEIGTAVIGENQLLP